MDMKYYTESDFYAGIRRDFGGEWGSKRFSEMPTELLQRYFDFWGDQPTDEHDLQLVAIAWELGKRGVCGIEFGSDRGKQ